MTVHLLFLSSKSLFRKTRLPSGPLSKALAPATVERGGKGRRGRRRQGRRSSPPPMAPGLSGGGGDQWVLAGGWCTA